MAQIGIQQEGRVLLATLDSPPHGLMNAATVDELEALVDRAEADDAVGAVVITGAHPDRFVAHYDVGELLAGANASPPVGPRAASAALHAVSAARRVPTLKGALDRTPAAGLSALERFHDVFLRMNRSGAVYVAAINGSAMGGGCELALACDQRVMADGDHGIGQPEILFGFPPGGGGTQRLTRLLGTGRALRLILDGGPLTPQEAHDLGLVDELAPGAEVVDRAVALAERLGRRPKAAVGACKRLVYEGGSATLAGGLHAERSEFAATLASADARAAMTAYVEQLEQAGELPGYDPERIARALEHGRFA